MNIKIDRIINLFDENIEDLIIDSKNNSIEIVETLIAEWKDNSNRFDKRGEILYKAELNNKIIGIVGINIDPYLNSSMVGRVRRLYVIKKYRRKKVGKLLILKLISHSKNYFNTIRLYTDNIGAVLFYKNMDFEEIDDKKANFLLIL